MGFSASWEQASIGSLLEAIIDYRGKTPPKASWGIPVLTAANVKSGCIDFGTISFVSQATYDSWITRGLPKVGDVLITTEAPVGEVASFPGDQTYLITRRLMALRGRKGHLDNNFLKYSLLYSGNRDRLLFATRGSTVPRVLKTDITGLIIDVPSYEEQRAIAHILGTLDDKIELNRQMNQTLEVMARAIFKSWFVDFDPVRAKAEGRKPVSMDAETAALFPDSFEESELGEIPKGWQVCDLSSCTSIIIDHRGKTPKKLGSDWANSGIPAVSAKNIKSGRLIFGGDPKYVDHKLYTKWMKEPLKCGDVLMTSEAPLGELFYVCEETNYCLSQRVFGLRANTDFCSSAFLYFSLESESVQAQIHARSTGTTVLGIRQSELRKILLILPPIAIQTKAAYFLEACMNKIRANENESVRLGKLSDTLLPKLLSGELRVKDAERQVEAVL
jgi:type I restriction enzyme, S subunit